MPNIRRKMVKFMESFNMSQEIILLAEDNPDDAFIFKMMFDRASLPQTLCRVDNGQEAIEWLSGEGNYADRKKFPAPNLLLLDLKMPIKNGFEVLEWLRTQKQFASLPIAVLSSSDDSRDLKRARELGVSNYFVKSPRLENVIHFLRTNQAGSSGSSIQKRLP